MATRTLAAQPRALAGNYADLSHAELLARRLDVDDPEGIDGLCRTRPDPELLPIIVGAYNRTPKGGRRAHPNGPWIWCSHCERPTHWKGYVITNATGQNYLIGNECGRLHYKADFDIVANDFNKARSLHQFLARLRQIGDDVPAIIAECSALLASNTLKALTAKQDLIRSASLQLHMMLKAVADGDGRLVGYARVRNRKAEAQRDARYDRELAQFERLAPKDRQRAIALGRQPVRITGEIYTHERVFLGHLQGGGLFHGEGLAASARRAKAALEARLDDWQSDFNGLSEKQLRTMEAELREALGEMVELHESCRLADRFFRASNLDTLIRWQRGQPNARFELKRDGRTLVIEPTDADDVPVETLTRVDLPDMPTCEQYARPPAI